MSLRRVSEKFLPLNLEWKHEKLTQVSSKIWLKNISVDYLQLTQMDVWGRTFKVVSPVVQWRHATGS
jgi:hypothetical protein